MLKVLRVIALLLLVVLATTTLAQPDDTSQIRFVHVIPGVAAVDIFVDGDLTVNNLDFGEASNYINVPVGTRSVLVRPGGVGTTLWEQQINAEAGVPQTLIASALNPLQFTAYEDDFVPAALGTTRFRVIHAISDAPAVTITFDGTPVSEGLEYGAVTGAFDVPAASYQVEVTAGDSVVVPATAVSFPTNTTHMFVLYGTASAPEALKLAAPMSGDDDSGFVRIVHAVPDAPAVDIYVDEVLAIPALDFGEVTEHLRLPAGSYAVELRVAGEDTSLLEANLDVEAGSAVTVLAQGTADTLGVNVVTDDVSGISAESALLSVINTIPGDSTVTVALADGTVIAEGIAADEISETVSIDPTTQDVTFTLELDGRSADLEVERQTFYGGVYYNVIALAGTTFTPPSLLFAPTALAQGIGSAPGAGEEEVVSLPPTVEAAAPTATLAPATLPPAVEPTQPPAPLPTVFVPAEPGNPTARILLDPGVNLQLRQNPNTNAFSLGLAPSGDVVEILGREGAPVDINGVELQVTDDAGNLVDFVDPASLLDPEDEDADLDPETTWIYFSWPTPDGGQVLAWNLALYLDIRDEEGEEVRLADLPLVPGNTIGEALATSVTPPPVAEDRVTGRVTNLDTGVNLNVRRTPDASSEILARLPVGTVIDFQGRGQSGEWYFVSYTTVEGGTVSGWVSTQYLQLLLNGENTTEEELTTFGLLNEVDEETLIGEIDATSSGVPQVVQPTANPLIDAFIATVNVNADANLNLRRTPSAQAEVLARIPAQTQIVVLGRTEDGLWLETTFENQQGWIASEFITLTFNGAPADINELQVTFTPEAETTAEATTQP
ncbi:MAG: hypothetical protein OHK0046_04520 [Anaerolineae bacterium]